MDAPYTESEVESLMVNNQLSRQNAIVESIWRTAGRAVDGALTVSRGYLPLVIRENVFNSTGFKR
jgi:hypothetical protein